MTSGGNGSLNLWKYTYPASRTAKDEHGQPLGVAGTVALINNAIVSSQPIGSFDWHADMVRERRRKPCPRAPPPLRAEA
jgi:hypothetical protein